MVYIYTTGCTASSSSIWRWSYPLHRLASRRNAKYRRSFYSLRGFRLQRRICQAVHNYTAKRLRSKILNYPKDRWRDSTARGTRHHDRNLCTPPKGRGMNPEIARGPATRISRLR